MHTTTAFTLTFLVLAYAVVSGLVRRWYVAPALIFVVFGAALGPAGLGLIEVENANAESFTVLAQLALTVILFNQAARLNLRTVLGRGRLTLRLLAIGIPVTIALGTLTAALLVPVLPLLEAVCLAVAVAPAEVALIEAVLEDRRLPERVRNTLAAESGFLPSRRNTEIASRPAGRGSRSAPSSFPSHSGWRSVPSGRRSSSEVAIAGG
jgi:sodium/hydrogen antiporter